MANADEQPTTEHIGEAGLLALLHGELERDESARVQRHLDTCLQCAGRLKNLAKFEDMIISATVGMPPPRPGALERLRRWWFAPPAIGILAVTAVAALLRPATPPALGALTLATQSAVRGTGPAPTEPVLHAAPGQPFELMIRLEQEVEAPVMAHIRIRSEDGSLTPLDPMEFTDGSALVVRSDRLPAALAAGRYTLEIDLCAPSPIDRWLGLPGRCSATEHALLVEP